MKRRKVKIFVGYQIDSDYHNLVDLKNAVATVKSIVEGQIDVNLEIQYGEFVPGKFLFNEVLNAIKECEIAIFDISENNPNVLIEVGLAYGNNKHVVLLKNELSNEKFKVPSDISAFIYVPYKDNKSVAQIDTCNQIANAILSYLKEIPKPVFYFKSLWGFNEADQVYIVCPEVEEPEKRQYPEPKEFFYLGKYGDIDSLLVVHSFLNKIYPQLNIKICTSEEFKNIPGNPYAANLILIGGPDYNKITEAFMKSSPFEFVEDEKEDTVLRYKKTGQISKSDFREQKGSEKVIDFGFFFKMPNPYNPDKKLIMINGIHTYGVYGAAKCFSWGDEHEIDIAKSNCKIVVDNMENDPDFAVIVEVKSINKKIGIPIIRKEELISV
jgi:hypothetical protein